MFLAFSHLPTTTWPIMNVSSTWMALGAPPKLTTTECMLVVKGNGVFVAPNVQFHHQVYHQECTYSCRKILSSWFHSLMPSKYFFGFKKQIRACPQPKLIPRTSKLPRRIVYWRPAEAISHWLFQILPEEYCLRIILGNIHRIKIVVGLFKLKQDS